MTVHSILITGANRGLGLEFCRQYATAGWRVFACCRHPGNATALQSLAASHSELSIYPLDVMDHQQIDCLSGQLKDEIIDILLNNAGVYGDDKQRRFGALDYQNWLVTLRINTLAPVKMAEALAFHRDLEVRAPSISRTSLSKK